MKLKATRGVVYQGLCKLQSITPSIAAWTWALFCRGEKFSFLYLKNWFIESFMKKKNKKNMHCAIVTITRHLHIITCSFVMLFWKSIFEGPSCFMHVWICACIWVSDEGFLHETLLSSALVLPQFLWRAHVRACVCVCVHMWLTQPWHICKASSCISICSELLLSEVHMTWPGSSTGLRCNTWIQQYPVSPPPHPLCWSRQTHSFFLTALQLLLTGGSERRAGKALSKFGCTSIKRNWFVSRLHKQVFCIVVIHPQKKLK